MAVVCGNVDPTHTLSGAPFPQLVSDAPHDAFTAPVAVKCGSGVGRWTAAARVPAEKARRPRSVPLGAARSSTTSVAPSLTSSDVTGRPATATSTRSTPAVVSLIVTLGRRWASAASWRRGARRAGAPHARSDRRCPRGGRGASWRGARRARRRGPPPACPTGHRTHRAPHGGRRPMLAGSASNRLEANGESAGLAVSISRRNSSCVHTLAPPAPVLSCTPSTGPIR